MRKLAIVVEGQTESLLVERMVREIAGEHNVRVERVRASGGAKERRSVTIEANDPELNQRFYILIYDSATDSRVASDILENYERWSKDFVGIVGLRDVYPEFDRIRLTRRAAYGQKTKPVRVQNMFAVMEIESWFLAELTHYVRMSPLLTQPNIIAATGFDPWNDAIEARPQPSKDLKAIYQSAGLSYNKSKNHIQRTLGVLSYEHLILEAPERAASLKDFVDLLNQFFDGYSWNDHIPQSSVA